MVDYGSTVRNNMMSDKNYTPYCPHCTGLIRSVFNGEQMNCTICGWESSFEKEFITKYISRHEK